MSSSSSAASYRDVIISFSTFLTVCIHTILYERGLYPKTTFILARKYNYPVRQSRHPRLCKWITDAVSNVSTELLRGAVDRVCLVIYSPSDVALERFVFDTSRFPRDVPASELDTPLVRMRSDAEAGADALDVANVEDMLPAVDLEEQFRAAMSRLSGCGARLKDIPRGCTFTLAVELTAVAEPPVGHPQPWIPAQPGLQKRAKHGEVVERGRDLGGAKTTPLRAVRAGEMAFEMWVEEGRAKFQATSEDHDEEGDDAT